MVTFTEIVYIAFVGKLLLLLLRLCAFPLSLRVLPGGRASDLGLQRFDFLQIDIVCLADFFLRNIVVIELLNLRQHFNHIKSVVGDVSNGVLAQPQSPQVLQVDQVSDFVEAADHVLAQVEFP